jgi:hypothetical protein
MKYASINTRSVPARLIAALNPPYLNPLNAPYNIKIIIIISTKFISSPILIIL